MQNIELLINLIKNEPVVYIQTHNFPDHDCVGAAFGLQHLLQQLAGIPSRIIYEGELQRSSLIEFAQTLQIDIRHATEYPVTSGDKIIIVDGCKGNKNVTDLIGTEVAVIDHHQTQSPDDVPYSDIRPEYGACSTIIHTYFAETKLTIPQRVATALLAGLLMDTSLMIRGVSEPDLITYSHLYPLADVHLVNSNLRNSIQVKDLDFYKYAIDKVIIQNRVAFCYLEQGCNQNLLGIIGDFFLALREVDFVFLCARNNSQINFSLRSEEPAWNAGRVIQDILKGIGFGGGHADMAGGIIRDLSLFNPEKLAQQLFAQLH